MGFPSAAGCKDPRPFDILSEKLIAWCETNQEAETRKVFATCQAAKGAQL
jgi:hypothetical protein